MGGWRRLFTVVILMGLIMPSGLVTSQTAAAAADSRFGLDFVSPPGVLASNTRFGQATALGVGWDRFPLYWSSMQSSPNGPIDFSGSDAVISADLAHGLAVQGILVGAPSWATTGSGVNLDAWSSFVSQTVAHYKSQVHYWEIWNEPDLLNGQGQGQYWTWGVPAYYQLLKTGYVAAKAADPSTTIILGGLAFPYNNLNFFPRLLAEMANDPSAAANHGYFDVLAFHSYDRVMRTYQLPLGYYGSPSFAGFRPLLQKLGYHQPIWVNELGVPVWDYGSGQNAPGRSTQDEQASYIVEALADGFAAGIDKMFLFQLYDDGAGAVDPRSNKPAEYFGLISNDGNLRPGYTAYQSAINLLSGFQASTHLIERRGHYFNNAKGIEIATFYGTNHGKVTVVWNDDAGASVTVGIPTSDPSATVLDKFGHTVGSVSAVNGADLVTLPPATNNNNFDCYTPHGCDPNDYVIGGSPVILVENDSAVPAALFDPLALDSVAPVHLSWHATQSLPAGATFDVQYRDAADGIWHDWLTNTAATEALFGDGAMQLQSGHTYEFRIRAHDGRGKLVGGDYTTQPLASTQVIGGNIVKPAAPIDGKIEIVWPHDNLPVTKAAQVNVTAELFQQGSTTSVSKVFTNTVHLWRSLNNGVGWPVAVGAKRLVTANNLQYPVWDFNDIDVAAARDPQNKYYFWTSVDGQPINFNVWSHGSDARTYFPQQDQPTGVVTSTLRAVDAKIEIVFPHDNLPVAKASQANVGVDLFAHGTLQSVPLDFYRPVRLYEGVNNGPLQLIATGDRVDQTKDGVTYPTWQFNNIDVSAAQNPQNRIYFWVQVVGVPCDSNVWTHGVDARTYFPKPDVPTAVAP